MTVERTFSIIKPDAVAKNIIGKILSLIEDRGLKMLAGQLLDLSEAQAKKFYEVHKDRPFYGELVDYMTSGPVFVSVWEGADAVRTYRDLMGATNPKDAAPGTIRALYADSISANAVHGSDSLDNAKIEIAQFFPSLEYTQRR